VIRTIPDEYTLFGMKLQLSSGIWPEVWPTGTPKDLEPSIVWF
jgi:hypothetical protein